MFIRDRSPASLPPVGSSSLISGAAARLVLLLVSLLALAGSCLGGRSVQARVAVSAGSTTSARVVSLFPFLMIKI